MNTRLKARKQIHLLWILQSWYCTLFRVTNVDVNSASQGSKDRIMHKDSHIRTLSTSLGAHEVAIHRMIFQRTLMSLTTGVNRRSLA